jgi:hypothetical protein
MTHSTAAACFFLTFTLSMSFVTGHNHRQQRPQSAKREAVTPEQKQRLGQHFRQAFERRAVERKQGLARLSSSGQQFLASERQKVETENRVVRTAIAGHRLDQADARFDAIEREARELSRRAKTATAAERAAIDRRAAELLAELRVGTAPR